MEEELILSKFISTIREKKGWSQEGLARRANVDLKTIEEVESGQLLFLNVVVRQKLARALKLDAATIKKYEKPFESKDNAEKYIDTIRVRILSGSLDDNECPKCGAKLICKIEEMYDLENNLVLHPKAHCTKCPFQIK